MNEILDNPSDYIESSEYFSWERYFTKLLVAKTVGMYLKYSKEHINPAYLNSTVVKKIVDGIRDIEL